jgi:hypothetical protein
MEIPSKPRSIRLSFMGAALVVLPALAISAYALSPMQVDAASESDICITATLVDDPTVVAQQGWCEEEASSPGGVIPSEAPSPTPTPTPPPVNNFANLTFESQTVLLRSLAVSADGKTMVATDNYGQGVLSTDSGKTWTSKLNHSTAPSQGFYGIGVSADGTKMIATSGAASNSTPGEVWVSTNSGIKWNKVLTGGRSGYGVGYYQNPTISKDGMTMIVYEGHYNRSRISTDSGATWRDLRGYLSHSAMSSDGKTIIAGDRASDIWLQVNGGSLTKLPSIAEVSVVIYSFSMSADGKTILVGTSKGAFISKDTGATWTENAEFAGKAISKVALSDDGSKMAIASSGIYVSTDSGATWALSKAPLKNFSSLQFSPDGSKIYAIDGASGSPWLIGTFGP